MAKYFLGSVGTAEAFRMENGELVKAFVSKTLTDSGLTISTTKDDVRAGTGAPIQFSFYHDPSVEITLTDVIFEEAYVEAQLGGEFKVGGKAYDNATLTTDANNKAYLEYEPLSLNIGCGKEVAAVWYRENVAGAEWETLKQAEIGGYVENKGYELTFPKAATEYCVRFVRKNDSAHIMEITSDIIPQELFLVITAPIYAGDACNASNGKKAGTITFEVPRFKLNGSQEFTMNMSSNQTMSLAGIALASDSGCDITGSQLLRIIAVYDDVYWFEDVIDLIADEDYLTVGSVPHIYALHKNNQVTLIDNANLQFDPANAVEVNDGEYEFTAAAAEVVGGVGVEIHVKKKDDTYYTSDFDEHVTVEA